MIPQHTGEALRESMLGGVFVSKDSSVHSQTTWKVTLKSRIIINTFIRNRLSYCRAFWMPRIGNMGGTLTFYNQEICCLLLASLAQANEISPSNKFSVPRHHSSKGISGSASWWSSEHLHWLPHMSKCYSPDYSTKLRIWLFVSVQQWLCFLFCFN